MTAEEQVLMTNAAANLQDALRKQDWLMVYLYAQWCVTATGSEYLYQVNFADLAQRSFRQWQFELNRRLR